MTQLLLALSTPPRYSFDNIVEHEGIREALTAILATYTMPKPPVPSLFLYGQAGTGKTHILRALASTLDEAYGGDQRSVRFIAATEPLPSFPDLESLVMEDGESMARLRGVVVDDVHLISGRDASHLWNLSNQLTRTGAPLMMGSRTSPAEAFSGEPHLTSRVTSGLVFRLDPPEDVVRMLIMDKMAADRHVRLSPDVMKYLITHKSRNISDLSVLLDILDRASLELKRRITVPLIKMLEKEGKL